MWSPAPPARTRTFRPLRAMQAVRSSKLVRELLELFDLLDEPLLKARYRLSPLCIASLVRTEQEAPTYADPLARKFLASGVLDHQGAIHRATARAEADHEPLGHAPGSKLVQHDMGADWGLANLEICVLQRVSQTVGYLIGGLLFFHLFRFRDNRRIHLNGLHAGQRFRRRSLSHCGKHQPSKNPWQRDFVIHEHTSRARYYSRFASGT